MGESIRQQKYGKLIQKDLGEIFQRDIKHLFNNDFITVTEVRMTPDLSLARVFVSMILTKDRLALMEKINEHKSEIRKTLGNKIAKQVRQVPDLNFFLDESLDNADKINRILSGLEIPGEEEE